MNEHEKALPAGGPAKPTQNAAKIYVISSRERLLLPLAFCFCLLLVNTLLWSGPTAGLTASVCVWYGLLGLYLGRTLEYTKTEQFVPMLEGRSSVGRLGLFIHVTAGFGDVGFAGYWTLEMFCIHPIVIYPNVEICQIYYHTIQGEYQKYDSGKYQNNTGVQPSMLYKDFLREDGSSK